MRLFAGTRFDQPPKCERCGALETDCTCPPPPAARLAPESQTARLSLEKRRKGKVVTVVQGLPAAGNDLSELLRHLKSQCGAGGTIDDGRLEIQGEQLDKIRNALEALGYHVRG